MKTHKGIFYFPSFEAARAWSAARGFHTDRIINYTRGWAIQLRISGPYVGPETILPHNPLEMALES